jgi:hypothetical protein
MKTVQQCTYCMIRAEYLFHGKNTKYFLLIFVRIARGRLALGYILMPRIKGIVSREEYFLKVLKIKSVFFVWAQMVITLFSCLFEEKIKNKVYIKSFNNSENPSRNPLQEACTGFQIAACGCKSCYESRHWFWKLSRKPATTFTLEKIDQ